MMHATEVFEQCIQFVSQLEEHKSEIEMAEEMGTTLEEAELHRLTIHKLKHAIEMVKPKQASGLHSRVLYHVALYSNAIHKPRYGISLCYIVMTQPTTEAKYHELAKQLLTEIKLKLPEDMYNDELKKTQLDIQAALQNSYKWLINQERHVAQPATKPIFNVDLLKKHSDKKAPN